MIEQIRAYLLKQFKHIFGLGQGSIYAPLVKIPEMHEIPYRNSFCLAIDFQLHSTMQHLRHVRAESVRLVRK